MWLSQFKLGRPGNEITFSINPDSVQVKKSQIASSKRVLSGHLVKRVFRTEFPTISLSGKFFTEAQADAMSSLLAVTDTHLSFIVRDDMTMTGEQNFPSNGGATVTIQENSATLLSAALVAASAAGSITVTGVFDNAGLTGTNYYTGGSYADATRTITLGTPLATSTACYCTYVYTGWLVSMSEMSYQAQGGWVDVMPYSGWNLVGV